MRCWRLTFFHTICTDFTTNQTKSNPDFLTWHLTSLAICKCKVPYAYYLAIFFYRCWIHGVCVCIIARFIINICEMPSFSTQMPSIIEEHEVDYVYANRNDHDEGLWEKIPM